MGAIVQALMTGEVKLMISSTTPQTSQLVKDGKLNMLGVAALEPTSLLPGVEPIARTLKGFEVEVWYAMFAPRGTPVVRNYAIGSFGLTTPRTPVA
jgi:tripartite-type tricarboxylate transporter receptor subunit TctC